MLRARFYRRIEFHADFIVIPLIVISDGDQRGAIAFANSSAIIYSDAGRPAHAESAGILEYSSVEYWPWVAVANAHATFIARCSGEGGRECRAAQAFLS